MAYHESLAAILEGAISDVEDGEIEEEKDGEQEQEHQQPKMTQIRAMDVDTTDGQAASPEEGELLTDGHCDVGGRPILDQREEEQKQVGITVLAGNPGGPDDVTGDASQAGGRGRPNRQKKKNKRSGKPPKRVNIPTFVRETCSRLQEKKYPLVWAAVKKLGVEGVRDLLKEVDVIEKCGGQMTNDGKRRRTPGGVLWNILRGRVQPDVYKEIMSQGNEVQKQKVKEAKESLKRSRMDVDEPVSNKRLKTCAGEDVDMLEADARGKRVSKSSSNKLLRPVNRLLDVIGDGPERDNSSVPVLQLQKAWVEGIQRKELVDKTSVFPPASSAGSKLETLKEGTLPGPASEKNGVPLSKRLRVPVQYDDLVREKDLFPSSGKQVTSTQQVVLEDERAFQDGSKQSPEENELSTVEA